MGPDLAQLLQPALAGTKEDIDQGPIQLWENGRRDDSPYIYTKTLGEMIAHTYMRKRLER